MNDSSTFTVLDPVFWASLEQRRPSTEFRSLVAGILPEGAWEGVAGGVWTQLVPKGWSGARQGWKLHLSATPANAAQVLERVAKVVRDDPVAFKFASDPAMLHILVSKNWPREGGGKFVTLYPADEAHFQRLARALAEATEGLDGPYILSDRRVPGSRIVFYRYGEHLSDEAVDAQGFRAHRIEAPAGGGTVADQRRGYYHLPEGMDDPYGARPVKVLEGAEKKAVLNGRYEVRGAMKYSNMGGIYAGHDLETDRPVVIRERRPFTGWVDLETDAVALLHKEARILRRMDGTGWTPRYVDAFQVWEHHYVVMEAVKGTMLRDHALSAYFRRASLASPRRLFWSFRRLILELVRGIEAFHRAGVVIRDLSVMNVLVRPDGSLCFLDFEYAWEKDGAQPFAAGIHTPGYASPEQMAGEAPSDADDFHALGAVVVELCSMLAPGLALNRDGVLEAAAQMMDEVGLPAVFLDVARGLLDPDPATRWDGDAVRRALAGVPAASVPWRPREPARHAETPGALAAPDTAARAAAACEAVCRFFEAGANPARPKALWPASPDAFSVNAVCVQFGACGPIEYVRRARGDVPGAWADWVEARALPGRLPPGLYVGLAGVALTLAGCGRREAARRVLLAALETPLLPAHAGLSHGAAGVGLAALALGEALDDAELREAARRAGGELARHARRRGRGLAWEAEGGAIPCGLGSGGSGIALFYTYLGAATGEARWLELARGALDYELAQVTPSAGFAFWPSARIGRLRPYRSPHVSFGSAGVGTAAARLYAVTGDPALKAWAERCADTLAFRWTNKLWQDMGYAGWGETLLDMEAATGEARWRGHALRVAEALLPHQVQTRFGTAFPGGGLNRVSSDFGMGASGIALFLHRLVHGGHRAFLPDHLLPGWPATAPHAEAADPEISDRETSDRKRPDRKASDRGTSNRETSNPATAAPRAASAEGAARDGVSAPSASGTSGEGEARRPAGRARARGRVRTRA